MAHNTQASSPLAVRTDLHSMGYHFARGGGRLYAYRDSGGSGGLYQPAEDIIRGVLANYLGDDWKPHKADSIIRYCLDTAPPLWEAPPLTQVNLLNGILNLETGEVKPFSPTFRSPVQLNVHFDPSAKCPNVDRFISEVFPGDAQTLAYEIAGWLCTPDMTLQKAVLLLGAGANGKSTYLNLLNAFLGTNNVSHVSLHDLGKDRFKPAELYGKLANICGDLPQKVGDSAMFKMITGGDSISAERKYGHPFPFRPFSRLVFSANELLDSPDSSHAFLRRWLVVPFPNRFKEREPDNDMPADNEKVADTHLLDELTTPKELSGLLNMALAAYSKVRERGYFSEAWSTASAKSELAAAIDPIADFLAEWTVQGEGESVPRPTLYSCYASWARVAGQKPISRPSFNQLLQGKVVGLGEKVIHGKRYLTGIGLVQHPINLGANLR